MFMVFNLDTDGGVTSLVGTTKEVPTEFEQRWESKKMPGNIMFGRIFKGLAVYSHLSNVPFMFYVASGTHPEGLLTEP